MKKNNGNAYLDGGHVRGPGTDTSDSIPANLSNGEFIVNAAIVKRPGMLAFLKKLNAGDTGIHQHIESQNPKQPKTQHFVDGGLATNDMQSLMTDKNDPSIQQDPTSVDPNIMSLSQSQQSSNTQDNNPQSLPQDPRLTEAIAERNKKEQLAGLLKGFQMLASARSAGYGAKPNYAGSEMLEQQASHPVADYNAQVNQENTLAKLKQATEEHKAKMDQFQIDLAKSNTDLTNDKQNSDPTSDISGIVRDRIIQKSKETGQPVNEDTLSSLSAKQLFPMFPYLHQDAVNVLQDKKLTEEIKSREAIAREGMQTRKDIAGQNAQARSDAMSDKADQKQTENDNKDAMKLNDTLDKGWAARGGQAGVVQDKLNSADRAQALLDQGKNQPDGLDSRQIEELAESTSRLIGGSAAASARIQALIPRTLLGRTQTLKEFLTNNPKGQEMQAFTDRLADTIAREKQVATEQKQQYQVESLAAHKRLKESNPDLFNEILSSKGITPDMIDEKGRYKKSGATGETVRIKDPQGNIRLIPIKDKDKAIAAGGTPADQGQ